MSTALPDPAFAVDGQIAITQAKAMAGGVTPGDAPGFPVTITQPGSYVLSGNLTVPDALTDAIVIGASHVTIDLNGFAILGPVDCSGGLDPCAGAPVGGARGGGGIITSGTQFNITVRNGTIQGMGRDGVALLGDSHMVEDMHLRSNAGAGVDIRASADLGGSIVRNCSAQRNGNRGIYLTIGSVTHSVASVNAEEGIRVDSGRMSDNVSNRNRYGIGGDAAYNGNTFKDNVFNITGLGVNLGQNSCNNAPCPGAQF
jgi:hypothetical protein